LALYQLMNVIVTGSSGFLGRHLTRALLEQGHGVYGLDKVPCPEPQIVNHKNFFAKQVDIGSLDSVKKAFETCKDIQFVFHTVALQPVNKDLDIDQYLAINVQGAVNILKSCGIYHVHNIIASSSFSVYGQPQYVPMDEDHPKRPNNLYGLSKLAAEEIFEFYARKMGMHIVLLRYDGIYGRGQTIPGFIEYLLGACQRGEGIELFNQGKQKRDNVFVDDVVQANLKAMLFNGKEQFGVFNIGGDEPKTSLETARTVKEILNSKSQIILSEKSSPLGYDVYMDSSKAKDQLGYKPNSLKENFMNMLKGSEQCQTNIM